MKKGSKHTEEAKQKMSKSLKGRIAWNKGFTKETNEKVRKYGIAGGKANKGKVAWNKGIPCSENIKKRISKKLKGFKHTEETRKKMSLAHKGEKSYLWKGGRIKVKCAWCGKEKMVDPYKLKKQKNFFCNKKCLGKWESKYMTQEKASNWQGGITPQNAIIRSSIEYRLWRKAVYERDNWICQKCGESGGKLNAHHINNFADYPEIRFAIDNGVTLCKKCHIKFHKKYGRKNNTKEQLENYLIN